jgi:hypothetical protein
VDFWWTHDARKPCAAGTSWPFAGQGSIYLSWVSQLFVPHPSVAVLLALLGSQQRLSLPLCEVEAAPFMALP